MLIYSMVECEFNIMFVDFSNNIEPWSRSLFKLLRLEQHFVSCDSLVY